MATASNAGLSYGRLANHLRNARKESTIDAYENNMISSAEFVAEELNQCYADFSLAPFDNITTTDELMDYILDLVIFLPL